MASIPDDDSFINNSLVVCIINILTESNVKLWELPSLEHQDLSISQEIIKKSIRETKLSENDVKHILKRLQKHTLTKLDLNKRYAREGIATFTIKLIGSRETTISSKLNLNESIDSTGQHFKENIIQTQALKCDNLKLICNGKVIQDQLTLRDQNIKNFAIIMAICIYNKELSDLHDNLNKNTQEYKMIEDIRDAIGLLVDEKLNRKNDLTSFKLENQNGVAMNVSREDKRCLTTGMILHEKGKNFIKRKEYLKALIVLAEADCEFKNCADRELIEKVDNYALLSMDIVWCYLCMQNLDDLRDAEERLKLCEYCLEKCYGSDLDRLRLVQGSNVSKYTPIFVRLNLLKGILLYHRGKKSQCKAHLDVSLSELQKNIVDENKVTQMVMLGFTQTQARLALKSTNGNIDAAIDSIMRKRELKERNKEINKELEFEKKINEQYGFTLRDQKPIDGKKLQDLMKLGYNESNSAKALIQSNNDFNLALDIVQSQFNYNFEETCFKNTPSDELITQVASMGFDTQVAKLVLQAFKSDLDKSIDFLLTRTKQMDNEAFALEIEKELQLMHNQTQEYKEDLTIDESKKKNAENLINDLVNELPKDDEEYLDFTLDEDLFFLNKYYSLLNM